MGFLKISSKKLLFSPTMNRIGLHLGEALSPRAGNWVVNRLTNIISRRKKFEQIKAVRANQWVISGNTLSGQALDERVRQVYYSSGISLYDYFHCMRKEERIRELIQFDDNLQYFLKRVKSNKERTLGLVLHMGAFDLSGYAIALSGARPLVLAYPNPNPGYQWQNELRKQAGLDVEPLTMESFQQATRHLRQGGTVITGVDRPWPGGQYHPKFFGRPSDIPVTTVQMAIRTETPVMLLACIRQPDQRYILHASELIELHKHTDRDVELVENTERVLSVAEEFISSAPEQWAMFYPVWPEINV
jgi:KDO2-lipid IV(A) lauroyltransferase